jgi:hypothetical protein
MMLDGGNAVAEGTLQQLLDSRDRRVVDFFQRIPHTKEKQAQSLLSSLDIEPL